MIHSVTTHNPLNQRFSRFIFGVVLKQLREPSIILEFDTPRFKFKPSGLSTESVRNLLKYLDFDYPRDENGQPLSYRDMSNKQMHDHVMWIEKMASQSGFTLKYIEDEWNRYMEINI